jgi:AcrR family transcriptional regulator
VPRVTGIDSILEAADASKMTLYSRFGSKDALLREVLLREGEAWRDRFFAAMSADEDGREPLSRVVRAIETLFRGERFYGCAFMNAIAEHTKGEAWLRELAAEHHRIVLAFLAERAAVAGCKEPEILARQLLLLIDGTIAALMVSGDPNVLNIAELNLSAVLGTIGAKGFS